MSNKTTNYNLEKPLDNEYYDVGVPNGNADIIDTELKKAEMHRADATPHMSIAEKSTLSGAVQSATVGGAAVPKSGTALQFPAYPVTPTSLKNPNTLTVGVGNGGNSLSYDGSAAQSITIPKVTKSTTATPSYTLAEGELYFSPN